MWRQLDFLRKQFDFSSPFWVSSSVPVDFVNSSVRETPLCNYETRLRNFGGGVELNGDEMKTIKVMVKQTRNAPQSSISGQSAGWFETKSQTIG